MNKKPTIGMITIGQSPRDDLITEVMHLAGINAEVIERGILDDLDLPEIEKLAPESGQYALVTKLRNGTPIRLAHNKIVKKVQSCIDLLVSHGVDLVIIFCSGEWPKFMSPKLVVTPGEVFRNFTLSMIREGYKLGVMVPDESQVAIAEKKWSRDRIELRIAVASPFGFASNDETVRAAKLLKESGIDFAAMDCIGYTLEKKRIVQDITGKPVVLVRSVLASIIREIVS